MRWRLGAQRESSTSGLVALEALPVLQRAGYSVTPSMLEMARMSDYELSRIAEFRIENEHGSITFPGTTDLRGLDLDELVEIEKAGTGSRSPGRPRAMSPYRARHGS